jgi:biopolymer transport protein ExbD
MKTQDSNGKYRIMAEINMIPFIDVSLVLLIIFMVMTPFLVKSQLKVLLPKAKSADTDSSREQMVEVQVQKDGTILINGQAVLPGLVEDALKQLVVDPETQPVVIQADKDVPFQHVVVVMDAAKSIGATKVGVGVKQETLPKQPAATPKPAGKTEKKKP